MNDDKKPGASSSKEHKAPSEHMVEAAKHQERATGGQEGARPAPTSGGPQQPPTDPRMTSGIAPPDDTQIPPAPNPAAPTTHQEEAMEKKTQPQPTPRNQQPKE